MGPARENHTPTNWQRNEPNPTQTQGVYSATRTRTYTDGVFTSATAWGSVTLIAAPTPLEAPGIPQNVMYGVDVPAPDYVDWVAWMEPTSWGSGYNRRFRDAIEWNFNY